MARYRMTPKRRAALRKAQAVSARKRRAIPNKRVVSVRSRGGGRRPVAIRTAKITRRGISKRHVAVGIGTAALVGAGTYGVQRHRNISHYQRERALIRKHRRGYIPPKIDVYHHTFPQGRRRILAQQHFVHKGRHHENQKVSEVWFTAGGAQKDMQLQYYGTHQVKIRGVKRSHIGQFAPGYGSRYQGRRRTKREARAAWLSVKREHLSGYKIEQHVGSHNPAHAARAQRLTSLRRVTGRRVKSTFAVNAMGIVSRL